MKIKDGFILRTVADSCIVVPVGERSIDFSGVITLNEVGAFLWKALEQPCDKAALLEKLTAEYDVDADTAAKDIDAFLAKLREANLLDD
ncbi:MAG: PqqD family protein [Firmicutes bacterium]|nr:PqqD family protein [Bacillota bacterium]